MKTTNIPFLAILALAACSTPEAPPAAPPPVQDTVAVTPAVREAVNGPANSAIKLVVAPPATQFPDAVLALDTLIPNNKKMVAEYKFKVNGFDLKAQTPDAATRGCANSKDGQHIHFILNNAPYKAE